AYPLMLAFESGCSMTIKLLLEYGANPKLIDLDDALERAIYPGRSLECVKIAINLGAKVKRDAIQNIVWRWEWHESPSNGDNANFVKIWQYLYEICPLIAK